MVRAVDLLRAKHEVRKWKGEQALHARDTPAQSSLSWGAGARRPCRAEFDRTFGGWHCLDLQGLLTARRIRLQRSSHTERLAAIYRN
jgi:hypothetical protein